MKKLMTTTAALLVLTVPAYSKSRTETMAYGIVMFAVYDVNCEKQPIRARIAFGKALSTVPTRIVKAAKAEVQKTYHDLGNSDWCELMRPIVEEGTSKVMDLMD